MEFSEPRGKQFDWEDRQLPINLFLSPGEYTKLLVRRGAVVEHNTDAKMPTLTRDLNFINQPIFEAQEQQKIARQQANRKKSQPVQSSKMSEPCVCCCCDDYCRECAKTDIIQRPESLLIDIPSILSGKSTKIVTKFFNTELPKGPCHKRQGTGRKTAALITASLIKEVEEQRRLKIEKIEAKQRKDELERFNELIRQHNRATSAAKAHNSKSKQRKENNYQKRLQYWLQNKELITLQLAQRYVSKVIVPSDQNPPRRCSLSAKQRKELRKKYGKIALQQEKLLRAKKIEAEKIKAKKLLAISAIQAEIIKQCPSKPFKPPAQSEAFSQFVLEETSKIK